MAWYWYPVILGVAAPWLILGNSLRNTFREGGAVTGISVWAGMSLAVTSILLLLGWIIHSLFG